MAMVMLSRTVACAIVISAVSAFTLAASWAAQYGYMSGASLPSPPP
jgi:hypothetical protein